MHAVTRSSLVLKPDSNEIVDENVTRWCTTRNIHAETMKPLARHGRFHPRTYESGWERHTQNQYHMQRDTTGPVRVVEVWFWFQRIRLTSSQLNSTPLHSTASRRVASFRMYGHTNDELASEIAYVINVLVVSCQSVVPQASWLRRANKNEDCRQMVVEAFSIRSRYRLEEIAWGQSGIGQPWTSPPLSHLNIKCR